MKCGLWSDFELNKSIFIIHLNSIFFLFYGVLHWVYILAEHKECLMKSNRSDCFTKCITNLPKKTWKEWFSHRHMRTKYLIFLGKWHQNRRLSGQNTEFSGLIIWDIFMMRYFQVSWDSNFNLNRLKSQPWSQIFLYDWSH